MTVLPDAKALLRQLSARGMSVERHGRHLLVTPRRHLTGELRAAIREQRHALLGIVNGEVCVPCRTMFWNARHSSNFAKAWTGRPPMRWRSVNLESQAGRNWRLR